MKKNKLPPTSKEFEEMKANMIAYAVQDMLDGLSGGSSFNFKRMEKEFLRIIRIQS